MCTKPLVIFCFSEATTGRTLRLLSCPQLSECSVALLGSLGVCDGSWRCLALSSIVSVRIRLARPIQWIGE